MYWLYKIRIQQTEKQKLFTAELAHEIRTPLANIRLYIDLIKRKKSDEQAHYCEVVTSEIDRLSLLIDNSILLAKLDAIDKLESPKYLDRLCPDTLVEKQLQNENNQSISVLAQNISSIKKLSKNITTALKDEEELMGDLESGFGKSDNMMGNTMNKLNKLMDSNGGNVL